MNSDSGSIESERSVRRTDIAEGAGKVKIRQILSNDRRALSAVPTGCLVPEAARRLAADDVGVLIVVDTAGLPAGVLSERDIARACTDRLPGLARMPVEEIMTPAVHTCDLDDTVAEIKARMTAEKIRHLPVLDNGALVDMVSMRDITDYEARTLEEDHRLLQHTEAKFRQVVEVSPNGIYVQVDGQIVFANCAYTSLLGFADASALIGRDSIEFFHPSSRETIRQRRRLVQGLGSTVPYCGVRFLRADGSSFPAETTSRLVVWNGQPAVMVLIRDITAQVMAEESLKASEERYRLLVDQSPEAAFVVVDRKVVFANRAYLAQVAARSMDDVVGRHVREFIHPDDRPIVRTQSEKLARDALPPDPVEVRRVRLDGSEYVAETDMAPLM